MSRPIRATPILRGEDAKRFLRGWIKECKNPSPGRVKFIREAEKHKDFYLSFVNNK